MANGGSGRRGTRASSRVLVIRGGGGGQMDARKPRHAPGGRRPGHPRPSEKLQKQVFANQLMTGPGPRDNAWRGFVGSLRCREGKNTGKMGKGRKLRHRRGSGR